MTANTPQQRRRFRVAQRLRDPAMRHALGMFVIGGGMGVAMTVHIQQKYDLYSSSTTMTLIGCVTAAVMFVVIGLLGKRWFLVAWAVSLIVPPVLFFFALRILERHPPVPPLG